MTNTELLQAIRSEVERIMRETGGSQFDIGKRCGMKDITNKLAVTAKINLDGFRFGQKVKLIIIPE